MPYSRKTGLASVPYSKETGFRFSALFENGRACFITLFAVNRRLLDLALAVLVAATNFLDMLK